MDSLIDLTVKELVILDESDNSDGDQQLEQEQAVNSVPDSESEDEDAGELMIFVYLQC